MPDVLVDVRRVCKDFRVGTVGSPSLFNHLRRTLWLGRETRELRALVDVTFRLERGQSLGLVGDNGSGKSTLLRLLAGIYRPTRGTIEVRGRLTPVLELGAGMQPDLSVRDNVFLYGAMIGFRRRQLESCFDEILAFAELGEFVGAKVRELSTGMRERLVFAITAHLDSDVLLLDEILAVGDRTFRERSFEVFRRRRALGKSVILASHEMGAIREVCDVVLLLDHGQQRAFGPTAEVLALYSPGRRGDA